MKESFVIFKICGNTRALGEVAGVAAVGRGVTRDTDVEELLVLSGGLRRTSQSLLASGAWFVRDGQRMASGRFV